MLGGPCMNLLIFLVLTVILLTTIGVQHDDTTTTVGSVLKCVVPAGSKAAEQRHLPCERGGHAGAGSVLKPRDTFVSIDGTAITSWTQLSTLIQPSGGEAS